MKIEKVTVGYLGENCYVLTKDGKVLIIDPGDEGEKIDEKVDSDIVGILITHAHFDHVGAIPYFENKYHAKVYDKSNLKEGVNNLDVFEFKVISFPGHKPDLIAFYFEEEKVMFVGEFIFEGSIGRCDLAGGSYKDMKESLEKVLRFDKDIKIYPGHGNDTSLEKEEKALKYFIQELQNN